MNEYDFAIDRAARALARAVAAAPGDAEHPGAERLEALVDGRLDGADAEIVQAHVDLCTVCAEDVADLRAMQSAIANDTTPLPRSRRWLGVTAAIASVAALIALAVWRTGFEARPTPPPAVATASQTPGRSNVAPAPSPPALVADVVADALTAEEHGVVARVLQAERLELPEDVGQMRGPAGTLLGRASAEPASFAPLAPIGTAVRSARPAFSWRPAPGATTYVVAVFDEHFTEVARSAAVIGTTWTPDIDLPRGGLFAWQITAHLPDRDVISPAPPQVEARFRVLTAGEAQAVDAEMTRLASQPLALGILLARAGLVVEASRALERAAADPAKPAEASAARTLLVDLASR